MTTTVAPMVYGAIAGVMARMATNGIAKGRRNQQQGYNFRGIDDVYNALSSALSAEKLVMLPRVMAHSKEERQTQKGGTLFYTTAEVEFDLVSAVDGSKHTIKTLGEAMDSADKSSNKAMSAAFKYAAMQAFCIPTEGDNDADATTHDVVARAPANDAPASRIKLDGPHTSKSTLKAALHGVVREIEGCGDIDQFEAFIAMPETVATIKQCERDAPEWAVTGKDMPAEFVPLLDRITTTRTSLLAAANEGWRNGSVSAG